MLRFINLLLICSLIPAIQSVSVPFKSCGSGSLKIDQIDAASWPPTKGSSDSLTVNGTLSQAVNDGKYSVKISLNGFPLPGESGDISEFKPVPWAEGPFAFDYSPSVPSIAPSGTYSVQLQAVDSSSNPIFCLQISFKLSADTDNIAESPEAVEATHAAVAGLLRGLKDRSSNYPDLIIKPRHNHVSHDAPVEIPAELIDPAVEVGFAEPPAGAVEAMKALSQAMAEAFKNAFANAFGPPVAQSDPVEPAVAQSETDEVAVAVDMPIIRQ